MKRILKTMLIKGEFETELSLPFAEMGIQAGFPSPAQDYIDKSLDFNKELIQHPSSTFYAKVVGNSMINAGIAEGDIMVIDRSLTPEQDDIVVALLNGEYTVKYLDLSERKKKRIWLKPANPEFNPIKVTPTDSFVIWGVVTKVIKNLR